MRNTWAVCKREFVSYFITPVGYVVAGVFALISGIGFAASFIGYARATQSPSAYGYTGVPDFEETLLSPFLVFCGLLIMFIGPLVTMRLLAEEKNRGTAELLLTHPLRNREIVFGKYGAALGMLLVMMAVVSIQMAVVWYFVPHVEPAVLGFGVITVFLMGAAFLSMGLFVSSITRNQVTAGTATFGLWFVSYVLGSLSRDPPCRRTGPRGRCGRPVSATASSARWPRSCRWMFMRRRWRRACCSPKTSCTTCCFRRSGSF